ncbi:hypothetical protein HDV05_007334 [Chytridiales sp. JEL 0842]|nr:hypothetical protein HDV05_007334 [Chytridiales sp. JEL 0842]
MLAQLGGGGGDSGGGGNGAPQPNPASEPLQAADTSNNQSQYRGRTSSTGPYTDQVYAILKSDPAPFDAYEKLHSAMPDRSVATPAMLFGVPNADQIQILSRASVDSKRNSSRPTTARSKASAKSARSVRSVKEEPGKRGVRWSESAKEKSRRDEESGGNMAKKLLKDQKQRAAAVAKQSAANAKALETANAPKTRPAKVKTKPPVPKAPVKSKPKPSPESSKHPPKPILKSTTAGDEGGGGSTAELAKPETPKEEQQQEGLEGSSADDNSVGVLPSKGAAPRVSAIPRPVKKSNASLNSSNAALNSSKDILPLIRKPENDAEKVGDDAETLQKEREDKILEMALLSKSNEAENIKATGSDLPIPQPTSQHPSKTDLNEGVPPIISADLPADTTAPLPVNPSTNPLELKNSSPRESLVDNSTKKLVVKKKRLVPKNLSSNESPRDSLSGSQSDVVVGAGTSEATSSLSQEKSTTQAHHALEDTPSAPVNHDGKADVGTQPSAPALSGEKTSQSVPLAPTKPARRIILMHDASTTMGEEMWYDEPPRPSFWGGSTTTSAKDLNVELMSAPPPTFTADGEKIIYPRILPKAKHQHSPEAERVSVTLSNGTQTFENTQQESVTDGAQSNNAGQDLPSDALPDSRSRTHSNKLETAEVKQGAADSSISQTSSFADPLREMGSLLASRTHLDSRGRSKSVPKSTESINVNDSKPKSGKRAQSVPKSATLGKGSSANIKKGGRQGGDKAKGKDAGKRSKSAPSRSSSRSNLRSEVPTPDGRRRAESESPIAEKSTNESLLAIGAAATVEGSPPAIVSSPVSASGMADIFLTTEEASIPATQIPVPVKVDPPAPTISQNDSLTEASRTTVNTSADPANSDKENVVPPPSQPTTTAQKRDVKTPVPKGKQDSKPLSKTKGASSASTQRKVKKPDIRKVKTASDPKSVPAPLDKKSDASIPVVANTQNEPKTSEAKIAVDIPPTAKPILRKSFSDPTLHPKPKGVDGRSKDDAATHDAHIHGHHPFAQRRPRSQSLKRPRGYFGRRSFSRHSRWTHMVTGGAIQVNQEVEEDKSGIARSSGTLISINGDRMTTTKRTTLTEDLEWSTMDLMSMGQAKDTIHTIIRTTMAICITSMTAIQHIGHMGIIPTPVIIHVPIHLERTTMVGHIMIAEIKDITIMGVEENAFAQSNAKLGQVSQVGDRSKAKNVNMIMSEKTLTPFERLRLRQLAKNEEAEAFLKMQQALTTDEDKNHKPWRVHPHETRLASTSLRNSSIPSKSFKGSNSNLASRRQIAIQEFEKASHPGQAQRLAPLSLNSTTALPAYNHQQPVPRLSKPKDSGARSTNSKSNISSTTPTPNPTIQQFFNPWQTMLPLNPIASNPALLHYQQRLFEAQSKINPNSSKGHSPLPTTTSATPKTKILAPLPGSKPTLTPTTTSNNNNNGSSKQVLPLGLPTQHGIVSPSLVPARLKMTAIPVTTMRPAIVIEASGEAPGTYTLPQPAGVNLAAAAALAASLPGGQGKMGGGVGGFQKPGVGKVGRK